MRTHTSFRATRHAHNPLALLFVSLRCVYRETDSLYCMGLLQIVASFLRFLPLLHMLASYVKTLALLVLVFFRRYVLALLSTKDEMQLCTLYASQL